MALKKPIQMAGMLGPRDRVWQAVRQQGKGAEFTALMVEDLCVPRIKFSRVNEFLRQWGKAGVLKVTQRQLPSPAGNRFAVPVYKLIKNSFEAPLVNAQGESISPGMGNLAMWRAMKVLKSFGPQSLARTASHPQLRVAEITARAYIRHLVKAGYLTTLREPTRQLEGSYKLQRDTGHHAPAITRIKCVFDQNLGQYTWQQPEQEVCDGLE